MDGHTRMHIRTATASNMFDMIVVLLGAPLELPGLGMEFVDEVEDLQ